MVLQLSIRDENNQLSEKYFQFLETESWNYEIHFNTLRNTNEVLLYILNFDDVLVKNPDIMKVYEKLRSYNPVSVERIQIYTGGYLHFDSQSLQLVFVHCSGRLNGTGRNDFGLIFGFYNHIYSDEELTDIGEEEIIEEPPIIEPENLENNLEEESNSMSDLELDSNLEEG